MRRRYVITEIFANGRIFMRRSTVDSIAVAYIKSKTCIARRQTSLGSQKQSTQQTSVSKTDILINRSTILLSIVVHCPIKWAAINRRPLSLLQVDFDLILFVVLFLSFSRTFLLSSNKFTCSFYRLSTYAQVMRNQLVFGWHSMENENELLAVNNWKFRKLYRISKILPDCKCKLSSTHI